MANGLSVERVTALFSAMDSAGNNMDEIVPQFNELPKEDQLGFVEHYEKEFNIGAGFTPDVSQGLGLETPSLEDVQQQGELPGEFVERGTAGKLAMRTAEGVSSKGGFGLPAKGAAALEAAGEAVFRDQNVFDEGFISSFRQAYADAVGRQKEIKKEAEKVDPKIPLPFTDAELPVVGTLSDVTGYMINPIGSKIRGAKKLGTISKLALEVGAVEGGESALDIISEQVSGEGRSFSEALKDEAIETAFETSLAGLLGVGGEFIAKPIISTAKPLLKTALFLGKRQLDRMSPAGRKLYERFVEAAKFRSKGQAQQSVEQMSDELAGLYSQMNQELKSSVDNVATEHIGAVEKYVRKLQSQLSATAWRLRDAIKSKNPGHLAHALEDISKALDSNETLISGNYAAKLDELGDAVSKQVKSIDVGSVMDKFRQRLIDSNVASRKSGEVVLGSNASPQIRQAARFLNDLLQMKNVDFKKLVRLQQYLGKTIQWGKDKLSPEEDALRLLWEDMNDHIIRNSDALPEQVVKQYRALQTEYGNLMGMGNKLRRIAGDLGQYHNLEEAEFLVRLGRTRTKIADLDGIVTDSLNREAPLFKFSDELAGNIKTALSDTRKAINVKRLGTAQKATTKLRKMAKEGLDAADEDVVEMQELVDVADYVHDYKQLMDKMDIAQPIRDALDDPLSKAKVDKARKFISRYAGPAKAELQKTLDNMAMIHRTGGEQMVTAQKIVGKIRDGGVASPQELAELKIAMHLEPRITKLLSDIDLAEAFIKENPSLAKTITKPGLQATEGLLGAEAVRPGGSMTRAALGTVLLGWWRVLKDPNSLLLFAQRINAKKPFIGEKAAFEIARAARMAGRIAALQVEGEK